MRSRRVDHSAVARMSVRRGVGGNIAVALLLTLTLGSTPACGQMLKLVGGAMTWTVNPEFLLDPAKRTVTFRLRTSWALGKGVLTVAGCDTPEAGKSVACPTTGLTGSGTAQCNSDSTIQDGCGVAEKFGVLCVAQLVRKSDGNLYAKYSDPNAQCVTEANAQFSQKYIAGSYNPDPSNKPRVRTDGSGIPIKIGIPNKLTVQQIYKAPILDTLDPASAGRMPAASVVLTGTLSHTVLVEEDVSEVVAWLAPRTGFANFGLKTGLLMPACSISDANTPCMFNECSLQRKCENGECQGAALRPSMDGFAGADSFWENWGVSNKVNGCGSGKSCLSKASPAVEAFVPLCSNDASSARKCTDGVNNYFSPVTSVPDLIEVAITPRTRLTGVGASWTYRGYNPYNAAGAPKYVAPHQAFRVQSFDYDGHQMTQYSPQLLSELKSDSSGFKMGGGDIDIAFGRNPAIANCVAGDVCCVRPVDGSGLPSMRVDCVASDTSPAYSGLTPGYWPKVVSKSGCTFMYDFDRDQSRQQGNLMKPDFPFTMVNKGADSAVFDGGNRFTQHVINTIDFPFRDMDNPKATTDHILNTQLNNEEKGQGIVQNIFSMFGCDAGSQNQPPVFVKSLCGGIGSLAACPDSTNVDVDTTHECAFWEPCTINLYARDFDMSSQGVDGRTQNPPISAAHRVHIQYALGYDHLPLSDIEPNTGANTEVNCCNGGVGHFKYNLKPAVDMDTVTGFFSPLAIGKIYVRCFVAYDVFGNLPQTEKNKFKSCPSMPLCMKIKITGSKPMFVAPTPLGNSFDDNGVLVPNRHDFPACEGYPMKMQLTVQDSLPKAARDLLTTSLLGQDYLKTRKYRIFIEDKDVGFDPNSLSVSYSYLKTGGVGNMDFFSKEKLVTSPTVAERCGSFNGYGAERQGNNDGQNSPNPLAGEGSGKSVMSPYRTGTNGVENCQCSQDPCSTCPAFAASVKAEASVTVTFESNSSTQNGVSLRSTCKAIDLTNGLEYQVANCREKLTNMDQVICAVGYDNARSVYKRWVGDRDPNGDDIENWLRDHSNGDQASEMHCFRILIAAPPVFVTDPTGSITPFGSEWRTIVDTTGVRAAYKEINFRVGQSRELIFLAQVSVSPPTPPHSRDVAVVWICFKCCDLVN